MPAYKHGNGRLQLRGAGGQFKQTHLSDFGLGSRICETCGAINPYELRTLVTENGFAISKRNEPPTHCEKCGKELTDNGE